MSINPSSASVAVEAVRNGTPGNVPANAITVVPRAEDPSITQVRNPDPTTGGTRTEFPRIEQKDVDKAIEALQEQLAALFQDELRDPSIAPPDTTIFEDTALLGEATPSVDATELVGQELQSFELGLTSTGTVVAVDPSPVEIDRPDAARVVRLARLSAGRRVRPDRSGRTGDRGPAVRFPVTVEASQVQVPDAAELKRLILGKPVRRGVFDPRPVRRRRAEAVARLGNQRPDPRRPGERRGGRRHCPSRIVGPSGEPAPKPTRPNPRRYRARARHREAPARGRPRGAPDRAGRRRWRRLRQARPFDTIRRRRKLADDAATLAQLVAAQGIVELVVGLPLEASGEHGPQAELTTAWAAQIADALGLPLTMRDERLTSHLAEQRLGPMKRGTSGGPPTRAQREAYRARVDREAAAIILQDEIEARAGVQYASPANPQRSETSP